MLVKSLDASQHMTLDSKWSEFQADITGILSKDVAWESEFAFACSKDIVVVLHGFKAQITQHLPAR